jgi:hypothetical protein
MNRSFGRSCYRGVVSLIITLLFLLMGLSACGGGGGVSTGADAGGDGGTPTPPASSATTYNDYNKSVANVSAAAQTFLPAVQEWEGSDFSNMTLAEIRVVTKNYIDSGNQFVSTLNDLNTAAVAVKKQVEKTVAAGGLPSGASVSPTLPIAVGGGNQ